MALNIPRYCVFAFTALCVGKLAYGQLNGFSLVFDPVRCCNGKKIQQGLCCNDQWQTVDTFPGVNTQPSCCGKSYSQYPKQLCCNGNTIDNPNPNHINMGCCNGKPYDAFTHKCCVDTLTPFSDSQNLWCCGNVAYSPKNASCCNGVIKANPDGRGMCCKDQVINPATQLCCDGNILPRENYMYTCCGASKIDNSKESCCAGVAKYRKDSLNVCCGKTVVQSQPQCCGDIPINPLKEICCAYNKIHQIPGGSALGIFRYGCCQSSLYDTFTSKCCNNVIVPIFGQCACRESGKTFCCGSSNYNPNEKVCCPNGLLTWEQYNTNCSLLCNDFTVLT